MLSLFTATTAVSAWVLIVLLHGVWRSTLKAELDPVRPSGPVE